MEQFIPRGCLNGEWSLLLSLVHPEPRRTVPSHNRPVQCLSTSTLSGRVRDRNMRLQLKSSGDGTARLVDVHPVTLEISPCFSAFQEILKTCFTNTKLCRTHSGTASGSSMGGVCRVSTSALLLSCDFYILSQTLTLTDASGRGGCSCQQLDRYILPQGPFHRSTPRSQTKSSHHHKQC